MWMIRGVNQAVLYLRDGLSMFDPVFNIVSNMRRIPLENIKRVEAMTSPGGVLWGANSFLGIVNVITKEAEDINGLELGFGGGHGPGDEMVIRPYVLYGKAFFGGRFKVMAHWSLEWFKGPRYRMPELWLYSPPPRIPGPAAYRYAGGIESDVPLSFLSHFDGKLSYAKPGTARDLTLGWQLSFHNIPGLDWGLNMPLGFLASPQGTSRGLESLRSNQLNWTESFVYLRYKDRWLQNRLGLNTRGYYIRFERKISPAVIFPQTPAVLSGLAFDTTTVAHRAGYTVDMDFNVARWLRLVWGGEVFYEWLRDADVEFRAPLTGDGQQFDFSKVSTTCPFYNRDGTGVPVFDPSNPSNTTYVPGCRQPFIFDSDRLVYALFLSAQVRPHKRLILDGGVRFQHAPSGSVPYAPQVLGSAAAVWNLYKELYLKVNWAMGFRPPVFNNTSGNGAAVQFAGDPDIKVETSQAWQAEINAKLLKNKGFIRQWGVRANYSYTILENTIRILQGRYFNSDRRGVHAVELFSDMYLTGGHRFTLAYTWVRQNGESALDGGIFRSVPNHWFTTSSAIQLYRHKDWRFYLNTSLRIIGAFEDPNRLLVCSSASSCTATSADITFDRVSATAILNVGFRLQGRLGGRLVELSANLYNALDGRTWASDSFYDLGARVELQPTPGPRIHFFVAAKTRL
jgi:outer membrane receptor protein involved in Fe transport